MAELDPILDTTFTLRLPGCSAWEYGVKPQDVASEVDYAGRAGLDRLLIIAESGELEGEEVELSAIVEAVTEAQS